MSPVQRTLLFRVDACPGSSLIEGSKWLERSVEAACVHDDAVHEFRKKLARRFKLKLKGVWMTTTFDDAWRPFFDHVKQLSREGVARLGAGYLTERLTYSDRFEWYRLEPRLEFTDRNRKIGTVQLLDKTWQTHASNLFRSEVERENLRGLIFGPPSFKPIKGDSRSWFGLHPESLAGRGLDHEWSAPKEPKLEGGRLAVDLARNDTAIVGRLDPTVAELCSEFPTGELGLASFPRIWAASLPDADFAGLAWNPGGNNARIRSILIRRSAVNALLQAGVLDTDMLGPIDVVKSRSDARVPILDEELGPLPALFFSKIAEHNSWLKIDEPATAPSEPRKVASEPAGSPPATGAKRVSVVDIQSASADLGITVPRVWQHFLSEIGVTHLGDMYPSHPASWVDDQPDNEDLKACDDALPSQMLAVGSNLCGDWYSLDLDHVSADGDCPLLKFDHETNQCVDCWPSVAELIKEHVNL